MLTGKGSIKLGNHTVFGYIPGGFFYSGRIELQARMKGAQISIGNYVATNNNIFMCAANSITIGNNCRIGPNVNITDFDAHHISPKLRHKIGEIGTVILHENVWIGSNVTILKNTEIGKNSIIAAGAVVTGKFPNNVIIGGVPAKIIKTIDAE